MAPRPDVSERRRSEIVEAAARVFSRKGFSGARMDDIVQETGLSKGLLYWYFKSKDAIIAALMERLVNPELARARSLLTGSGTVRERMARLAEGTVEEIRAMQRFVPITFEFYSLAFRNRVVKRAVKELFASFTQSIQQVVEQGIEQGELRPVDARAIALVLTAAVEGSILLWIFDPDVVDLGQIRLAMDLVVQGIENTPAGEAAPGGRGTS